MNRKTLIYKFLWLIWFAMLATSVQAHNLKLHSQTITKNQELSASPKLSLQPKAQNPEFRKLFTPTDNLFIKPDTYRNASGMPGKMYWENRTRYNLKINVDTKKHAVSGEVDITYYNNSPDDLSFIWVHLEQQSEQYDQEFIAEGIMRNRVPKRNNDPITGEPVLKVDDFRKMLKGKKYGFRILSVKDEKGNEIKPLIQGTMMRLPISVASGSNTKFSIKYHFDVPEKLFTLRMGYEAIAENVNAYYLMQSYPRVAYYSDYEGWDIRPYLGTGEFYLPFGDFDVEVTLPANYLVVASGQLINSKSVLSSAQLKRFNKAQKSNKPVDIVTEKEIAKNQQSGTRKTKTWKFSAKNVREVAIAASNDFGWQSMSFSSGVHESQPVIANSFYLQRAKDIVRKFSLPMGQHTINTFSHFTFDYPYPVLNLVQGTDMGMEYPMLATYDANQEADGTYSIEEKTFMLTVLAHEIGHNYFPMVIGTNERKWAWVDEGIATFMHKRTLETWGGYLGHAINSNAKQAMQYMEKTDRVILMEIADNMKSSDYYVSSYEITATGFNILRETILGRELFDDTFRAFSQAWKFKHPTPYDLFRFFEKYSGRDLGWFWRGWFYSKGHVDIAVEKVNLFKINPYTPEHEAVTRTPLFLGKTITQIRDKGSRTYLESNSRLKDVYDQLVGSSKPLTIDREAAQNNRAQLSEKNHKYLTSDKHFIHITLSNRGGIVMPVIVRLDFEDGTNKTVRYSANIWRQNEATFTDIVVMLDKGKNVKSIQLDPFFETFDTQRVNNHWVRYEDDTVRYISLVDKISGQHNGKNLMQILNESQELQQDFIQ